MDEYLTHNLTGRVIKVEGDYFAYGGYGDVWKGKLTKSDSDYVDVAVKVPRVTLTNTEDLAKCTKMLRRETGAWSTVNHPNITPFYGISSDFHRAPTPCLVSPYYRHGDIATYLKERPGVDRIQLITQIAIALSYLHSLSRPIIHGDIKASNILINDNLEASLMDFGLSRVLEASGYTTKTATGTMRWQAYELLVPCKDGEEELIPRVTEATDIWAFAMTVIEIITGCIPFSHLKSDAGVVLFVVSGGRPQRPSSLHMNDEIWVMLERCWHVDPMQRPSMAALARFFASHSNTSQQANSGIGLAVSNFLCQN